MNLLMVFLGGGLGSLCRYSIALGIKPMELIFPYATLIANALSCIILGTFVALANTDILNDHFKLMVMTGFCGGFSTYSTFTNETYQLLEIGNYTFAFLNIFGNLFLCLLCIFIGLQLGKQF